MSLTLCPIYGISYQALPHLLLGAVWPHERQFLGPREHLRGLMTAGLSARFPEVSIEVLLVKYSIICTVWHIWKYWASQKSPTKL